MRRTKEESELTRTAILDAAERIFCEQGYAVATIDGVSRAAGVTRGAFYWHFKDRQDLLMAVLETWKEGRIKDIIKQTTAQPGKEREQIYHVIQVYSLARNRKGIPIELAVRDWARRDPQAAAIVEEVDTSRLECTRKLFVACGLSEKEAKSRSLMLYAYVFGQSLMIYDHFDDNLGALRDWIADRIVLPTP